MTLENFRDLGLAMMVAMVMIFLLLVAQFKQFLTPALIMVTIPLGLIGIMFGFVLLDLGGIFLTATSLIGFIALMGIVVNNAILYLEQFNLEREAGAEIREALIESGRIRLRPILLTSLTTILGSLTIISDPVWSGLAWSIIFGLSLSSLLTLGVFPVLMYTFNNKA
jgi:multidrug efflux pump subunit AcrB